MKQLSVIVTNASQATLRPLTEQPADLMAKAPAENDREAMSLLRQCGLRPRFERAGGSVTPKAVSLNPSEATNWKLCGETIAELMAPAPEEKILEWLGMMSVLVAKKGQDETVTKLELIAYARKLREWPADVVRTVLDRYPNQNKWWPEWSDLYAVLSVVARERMMLAQTFNRWVQAPEFMARREGLSAPVSAPGKALPAPADRVAVRAAMPDPEVSQEQRQRALEAKKQALREADEKARAG